MYHLVERDDLNVCLLNWFLKKYKIALRKIYKLFISSLLKYSIRFFFCPDVTF